MKALAAYLRTLDPHLPRSVQMLQLGGLFNAIGNGLVLPFTLIYLHNVRGIVARNRRADRGDERGREHGRRAVLRRAGRPLRRPPDAHRLAAASWRRASRSTRSSTSRGSGFVAAALTGIGNGGFWASQSTLIAGLTAPEERPAAFAMQRVVMNLGIGLGGVTGGLIATTDRPEHVRRSSSSATRSRSSLYLGVLTLFVPRAAQRAPRARRAPGPLRRRAPPPRAPRRAGAEHRCSSSPAWPGSSCCPSTRRTRPASARARSGCVYLANTLVIVLAQLPDRAALAGAEPDADAGADGRRLGGRLGDRPDRGAVRCRGTSAALLLGCRRLRLRGRRVPARRRPGRRSSPTSPTRGCSAATWRSPPSRGRSASRSGRPSAASGSRSRRPRSGSSPACICVLGERLGARARADAAARGAAHAGRGRRIAGRRTARLESEAR